MSQVKDSPLVTVLLPVFNGERFLDGTLQSARSQSHRNLEILVVDDGSTDGSRAIVERHASLDPRVRLIVQQNAGVARARNNALAQARGEFIAALDADDLWAPQKIEQQVQRLLEAGSETAFAYCWWVWIDASGQLLDQSPPWRLEGRVLQQLIVVNFTGSASGPLFRRSCLQEIGGYDEELVRVNAGGCEDLDVALRLAERFPVVAVPEVLLGYRRTAGSMSSDVAMMCRSQQRVLRGVRDRHPELHPRLFRASARVFALYLAGVSFWSGRLREAFYWGFRSGVRLPLQVAPYVLRLLLRPRPQASPVRMVPGVPLPSARLPRPLIPYDRLVRLPPSSLFQPRFSVANRTKHALQRLLQELFLLPLRAEALLSPYPRRRPRVLAMACWHFPVYSQTFVYRELCALARAGYNLRFAYAEATSRRQLPDECGSLWPLRRRLLLSDATAARDLQQYQRRMPERVNAVLQHLSEASGLSKAELLAHRHVQHAFSFTRMAEVWKPDYIHTYFFYEAALFGYVASSLLDIPRGVSCYADHMLEDYALKVVPLHLATTQVLVATSARIRQELEQIAGRMLPAAVVKPNGIDASLFHGLKGRFPSTSPVVRVLAVNRLHPKKGCIYLLEAARILRDQGIPLRVDILGEPDAHDPESAAYSTQLQAFIASHGLQSTVLLRGRQTAQQVHHRLHATEVFVAPFVELPNGDKDGIPTALLEAMAAGCAVISTDAGSIPEVFDDGVEGLQVPQRNPSALAEAIKRLASDSDLRKSLADAAVRRVQRQFDVSRCEEAFHQRVHSLLATRPRTLRTSETP